MVHQQNFLKIFDTNGLYKQIRTGNLHPKDVGFLLDNFNEYNRGNFRGDFVPDPKQVMQKSFFGVCVRANLEPNSLLIPDTSLNTFRARYHINTIECDRAKWKFMERNKMNYGWGYACIRS